MAQPRRAEAPPQRAVYGNGTLQVAEQKEDVKSAEPLIEFSTEAQADPNEGIVFSETPVQCSCPHCERKVITFIDHETSFVTWLLGFVVWISLGWMAFWVVPFLWPAFKDVVHHCPRCLNVVARKSRIRFPSFKTEVMTIKIGGCAIVLARKYVIIATMCVIVIMSTYFLRSTVHLNAVREIPVGPTSSLSWEDFLWECGPRSTLQRRGATARAFDSKYLRRTFTWQGQVRQIREGFDLVILRTKPMVMVSMYPPRYPNRELVDIALLFNEALNVEVAELNPDDWVEFQATMAAHGHRGDPEVMTLQHIKVITKPSFHKDLAGPGRHTPGLNEIDKNRKDEEVVVGNSTVVA